MSISKATQCAKKFLIENGFNNIIESDLELILAGRNILVKRTNLKNADARIVFGDKLSVITLDNEIEYEGSKRFTLAHELGHFEMHRGQIEIHADNIKTLSWFDTVNKLKRGQLEREANEFATELLMPSDLFKIHSDRKKFSPSLLWELSETFKTSITSVVFRYLELGHHPICVFFCQDGKVKYWKKSDSFNHFIIDRTKLSPPEDSVANEFYKKGTIYSRHHAKQQIWKSTWHDLKSWESDTDYRFYEYAIVTPKYGTVLSVVWEE